MYLKYIFIVSALLFAFMIGFFKLYVHKKQTQIKVNYLHILIWVMFFYILSAFLLVFFVSGEINKMAIFLVAISPFIIGKFASYKTEKIYSFIQIICAIISAVYIYQV